MGLSAAQIAQYAAAAGFSGADLQVAVAVALAESSGNPQAYNPETAAGTPDGQGSYGLWQIYLNAHPEFAGVNLYDPQTNASAAFAVFAGAGGFSPWSTYGNGAYLPYMSAPPAPAASSTPPFLPSTSSLLIPAAAPAAASIAPIVLGLGLALVTVMALEG